MSHIRGDTIEVGTTEEVTSEGITMEGSTSEGEHLRRLLQRVVQRDHIKGSYNTNMPSYFR